MIYKATSPTRDPDLRQECDVVYMARRERQDQREAETETEMEVETVTESRHQPCWRK